MSDKAFAHIKSRYIDRELKNKFTIQVKCVINNLNPSNSECSFIIQKNGNRHNAYGCTNEYYDMLARDTENWSLETYGNVEFLTYIGKRGKQ